MWTKKYSTETKDSAVDNYIEFYKNKRLEKKLKGLSPIEYRTQTLVA